MTRPTPLLATLLAACLLAGCTSTKITRAALGTTLLSVEESNDTVAFVDAGSGTVLRRVRTGPSPREISVSLSGQFAAVTNHGRGVTARTLTVINLPGRRIQRTVDLGPLGRASDIVFVDAHSWSLVALEDTQQIARVGVRAATVDTTWGTDGLAPMQITVSPDLVTAYFVDRGAGLLGALDTVTGELAEPLPVGAGSEGLALSPDGSELWVAGRASDTLTVVDTGAWEVVATLECPGEPARLEVTPDGARVLVTCPGSDELAVLRRDERAEEARVSLGEGARPVGLAADLDTPLAWVSCNAAGRIALVDLGSMTETASITLNGAPAGIAWSFYRPLRGGDPTDSSGRGMRGHTIRSDF